MCRCGIRWPRRVRQQLRIEVCQWVCVNVSWSVAYPMGIYYHHTEYSDDTPLYDAQEQRQETCSHQEELRLLQQQVDALDAEYAASLAAWSDNMDALKKQLRDMYRQYIRRDILQSTLLRNEQALDCATNCHVGNVVYDTADMFERQLTSELSRHGLSSKMVIHDKCEHAYFVRTGSRLEKTVDAVVAKTLRQAHTSNSSNPFEYTLMGGCAMYSYWNLSQCDGLDPGVWKLCIDSAEQSTSLHHSHIRVCKVVKDPAPSVLWSTMPETTQEAVPYIGTESGGKLEKWIPLTSIYMDASQRRFGSCITLVTHAMLKKNKVRHDCVVCRLVSHMGMDGPGNDIASALDKYYTRETLVEESDGWNTHVDYESVPPTMRPTPWSVGHITRMINMSLFSMINTVTTPLDFEVWIRTRQPDMYKQYNQSFSWPHGHQLRELQQKIKSMSDTTKDWTVR